MSGERLRAARVAAGYKNRADAARKFKINYHTLAAHESGAREIDKKQAAIYSRYFGVAIEHLLALDLINSEKSNKESARKQGESYETRNIPVRGYAAGGLWLEAEEMLIDDDVVSIPADPRVEAKWQYARKVKGNSVSNQIRDGEYAVFVELSHYGDRLRGGELVDCQRTRAGLYEHSVKIFDGDRLMTDNAELDTQQSIPLASVEDDTTVEILGVAIGVFRPLYVPHK